MKQSEMINEVIRMAERLDDEIKSKIPENLLDNEYVPYVIVELAPGLGAVLVKYCNTVVWSSENDCFEEYETAEAFESMLRGVISQCAMFMATGVAHFTAKQIFGA